MENTYTKTTKILHLFVASISALLLKYYFAIHNTREFELGYLVLMLMISAFPLAGYYLNKSMTLGLLRLEAEKNHKLQRALLMAACMYLAVESIDSLIFHYVGIT